MRFPHVLNLGLALVCAVFVLNSHQGLACTNFMVTRGASIDSSVTVTYTCDGEFHPRLNFDPAADHRPGDSIEIRRWGGRLRGKVAQVPHTYAVLGLMNEYQVAFGETTFGGRKELEDSLGILPYWDLMRLSLQRAKTAREVVTVIGELVAEYGYGDEGESFSIGDPHEVWYMEIAGTGPGGKGAVWVALRVPDGYVCAHANRARIGEFPMDDPANCLHSPNVVSFAVKKGYYDPKSGKPFRFCEAYCPAGPQDLRYCDTRVWSVFCRCAPSQEFSPDVHRGVEGAKPYPLWIKPDKKLSMADVMSIMRDHYEGTPYDMTKGVDAGPFGSPNHCRPMTWEVDSTLYGWERAISTPQTGFSFISQSRDWLPNPIGGVYWYGVDDTYFSVWLPLYCGITAVPSSFTTGSLRQFSWESAWWVFNFVANYANLKYSYMKDDIIKVRDELENQFLAMQPVIEETALGLRRQDALLLQQYLTDYSVSHAEEVVRRYRELGEFLICKYNDGYVKDSSGRPQEVGYPQDWLRDVVRLRPKQFAVPRWKSDTLDAKSAN
ncbi:MAG: C69 family dipeptidase [Candidatus Zixiibacteriota bacterium]